MSDLKTRIAGLSAEKRALLALRLRKRGELRADRITPRADQSIYPLSSAQRRLWFLDQIDPGTTAYIIPAALRVHGPLNVAALEQGINAVARRHEVLRASFPSKDGEPQQVIAPVNTCQRTVTNLEALGPEEKKSRLTQEATEEGERPFDLSTGPLFRVKLFRLGADDHILLLTFHHIVFDGWSTNVFVNELLALYRAFSTGLEPDLPPLPLQYADYAAWQNEQLQSGRYDEQIAYWRKALADSSAVLDIPGFVRRSGRRSSRGDRHRFRVAHSAEEALKDFARREDATLFMVLATAFGVLLHRYVHTSVIRLGTPVANRGQKVLEGLIGFVVNTIVLPVDLSGDPTFNGALRRVRESILAGHAHQDVPFERIVEELRPPRDPESSPLFQVMFDLQRPPLEQSLYGDLQVELLDVQRKTSKFDLSLIMIEEEEGLVGEFEYSTDLFDESAVRALVDHFQHLLSSIGVDTDLPISRYSILSAREECQILKEWNATALQIPVDMCVHTLFEQQVHRTPDRIAVSYGGASITYYELNLQANRLAHYLRRRGVGPEVVVGLFTDRSVEMVIGLLGILKAGGAYVPLDPTFPQERIVRVLRSCGMSLCLTQASLASFVPGEIATCVILDAKRTSWGGESDTNPVSGACSTNLAYMIFTSGTSGTPKGVMVQHGSVVNLWSGLLNKAYAAHLQSPLRISLNVPLPFDASVQQLVMLLSGHTIVVVPGEIRADGEALLRFIRDHRLDVFEAVPSQVSTLLEHGLIEGNGHVPALFFIGGEAIDETLWRQLSTATRTTFCNVYGPTECTVISSLCRVQSRPERPSIGRPTANARIYLLDPSRNLVPVGVVGEICVAGDLLARGYVNAPDGTAEQFIPDCYSGIPGGRLYRTGDLARCTPDGSMEFVGRIDQQVKLRGVRIEPLEIEMALAEHPLVHRAIVDVDTSPDSPRGQRLVAYVLPREKPGPSGRDPRSFLRRRIPDQMIPNLFVEIDTLPLTAAGKIDRKALPHPTSTTGEPSASDGVTRTATEKAIAAIFSEVLGLPGVAGDDNFFDLGGHSLMAARLANRVRMLFHLDLPLRAVFEHPTVAGLAECIDHLKADEAGDVIPAILPVSRDKELPLSFSQQRLWFLDLLEPGSALYTIAGTIQVQGRLDVTALQNSINEIVRRHEVLRTTFSTVEGRAVQVISPSLIVPLRSVNLRHLEPSARQDEARHLAHAESLVPFDLSRGPLFRVALYHTDEGEALLSFSLHHIVSDGWSTNILIRELATAYEAFLRGRTPAAPDLPVQYADFAAWQRQWVRGEVLSGHLAYWRKQLAGVPPVLELPTDRPRPTVQTYEGALHKFDLSPYLSEHVRQFARQEGVTPFVVLLAGFKTALSRYSGQEDISVGTPVASRIRPELEGLIGFFVNTLVLRTQFNESLTFRTLVHAVRDTALDAYAHQDLPFEMLVDALHVVRDLRHAPLFQVMFVLQDKPLHPVTLSGVELHPLETDLGVAEFDLTLSMVDAEITLRGTLEYNRVLFERDSATRFVDSFIRILEEGIRTPDRPLRDLDPLSDAERKRLLREWNETSEPLGSDTCIHQIVEQRAAASPHALAVDDGRKSLTFTQLNRRANQLARYLVRLGVGRETVVGIGVERSAELVVGVLGVLKAGGAYLPLDPEYPRDRIAFMCADAGVRIVLSQRSTLEHYPPTLESLICLDDIAGILDNEDPSDQPPVATPENLAYLIYTSGSTGSPKGVEITHRSVMNENLAVIRDFGLHAGDRVLQFVSLNSDPAAQDIFPTLFVGATLVLRSQEHLLSASTFSTLLESCGITAATLPTAFWSEWVNHIDGSPLPASLRLVVVGGERVPPDKLAVWHSLAPDHLRWINQYGPTESTITSTMFEPIQGTGIAGPPAEIPIGRPIANTQVYVLDRYVRPVPLGVDGEIVIGGEGIGRGYRHQPALTAERFVPDPFSPIPGSRLYRTGDKGRFRPDGLLEFRGRYDRQVKLRGYRVEPGEIEAVLRTHPAIRDAVVDVHNGQQSARRLVAYCVLQGDDRPTASQIREFLKVQLPDYMVPWAFVPLDALPLTPAGKVDRQSLPAPDSPRAGQADMYEAPRFPGEQMLVEIWQQVLGIQQLGIHDNFFEVGGDSIHSIQVIARARQRGIYLTPKMFYLHPTIAELVAASSAVVYETETGQTLGPVPLTPIQHWFFAQRFVHPHHWNQSVLLEVHQRLDPDILSAVIRRILEHHDALRLRFVETSEGWRQSYAETVEEVPFRSMDLSSVPPREQTATIQAHAAEMQESLNLAHGPLLRGAYYDRGESKSGRLLMVIHHLVVDTVSWRVMLEDMVTAYGQLARSERVQLPPRTTSFKVWAERLQESARSIALQEELSYWRRLSRLRWTIAPIPVDTDEGSDDVASAETIIFSLTGEETGYLVEKMPGSLHLHVQDMLLTAFARALGRWTGKRSFLIDLEGHGRDTVMDDIDLSRTVGWCTAIYPVVADLGLSDQYGTQLAAMRRQLSAVPQRGIGYGVLKYLHEDAAIHDEFERFPTASISFNYIGRMEFGEHEKALIAFAPESPGPELDPQCRRSYPLAISVWVKAGQLEFMFNYSRNRHHRSTIEKLAQMYTEELQALIRWTHSPDGRALAGRDAGVSTQEMETLLERLQADQDLAE